MSALTAAPLGVVGQRSALALCVLALAACEEPAAETPDAGAAYRLLVLDPPGSQIGLRYGKSIDLAVRYVRDDLERTPVGGAAVRFAIFDDPVGSTLARDVVDTDGDGLAFVTLTAGGAEGGFRVRASAPGAEDVEFAISISELEFVEIDAQLVDPLPSPGTRTLTAALYTDRTCDTIPAAPKLTGASRSLVANASASATLAFVNLLSRRHAVVGRVESGGELVAFGCLDLDRALLPPGAHVQAPIAMRPVRPAVLGDFLLDTSLGTSRAARADGLFRDIDVLDRCVGHLGQLLLDELAARVDPSRAAAIAAVRGATMASTAGSSTVSCRPAKLGNADTLDLELGALVSASGTPGDARDELIADLDAILQSGRLASRLALSPTGDALGDGPSAADRVAATHTAIAIDLALGTAMRHADLELLGLPVTSATGVRASADATTLRVDPHPLPIGVAARWGEALGALSIDVRLPALPVSTLGAWAQASALAAQRNAKAGCAAIEDLVCERTGATACAGTLLAPCALAVAAVATRLDAAFLDDRALVLTGSAVIDDSDGDLVADTLGPGQWQSSGALAAQLSFSGARTAP